MTFIIFIIFCVLLFQVKASLFIGPEASTEEPEFVKFSIPRSNKEIRPIVLLNGLGCSSLDAKLDHVEEAHWWCRGTKDWFRVWINIEDVIPHLTGECFLHNVANHFDAEKKTWYNSKGVSIRVTDYGGTSGMEYLSDDLLKKKAAVYATFVDYFVQAGYKRGISIRGGGYDWRLGPQAWEERGVFKELEALIEETYEINNRSKVSLVGHSLGGPYTAYFLATQVSQEWKDKYIRNFFSLGGSFDGGFETIPTMISGVYNNAFPLNMKSVMHSIGGMMWMIPSKIYQDRLLVQTPSKNYTNSQLEELFKDLGLENSYEALKYIRKADPTEKPPGVKTYCWRGTGFKTARGFKFDTDDLRSATSYEVIDWEEDGDCTVVHESGEFCDKYADMQKEEVVVQLFEGKQWKEKGTDYHKEMVNDPEILNGMYKAIYSDE